MVRYSLPIVTCDANKVTELTVEGSRLTRSTLSALLHATPDITRRAKTRRGFRMVFTVMVASQ
jgi:hypothetical protein